MEKEFNLKVCPICGIRFKKHYSQICCSPRCKKIRKMKKHKKLFSDSARKYAKKNKKKINAKAKANYHIDIPKGQICQFKDCNKLAKVKHHEDYDKPLVVKFYCREHHSLVHRRSNG